MPKRLSEDSILKSHPKISNSVETVSPMNAKIKTRLFRKCTSCRKQHLRKSVGCGTSSIIIYGSQLASAKHPKVNKQKCPMREGKRLPTLPQPSSSFNWYDSRIPNPTTSHSRKIDQYHHKQTTEISGKNSF